MADAEPDGLARAAAGCLAKGSGPEFLAGLRRLTVERELPPDASDAELRDLEGQRRLFRRIERLVERGLKGTPGSFHAQTEEA